MRVTILPTPGDPFLLTYWWEHFKPLVEQHEIDRLIIIFNSPLIKNQDVRRYLTEMFEGVRHYKNPVTLVWHEQYIDHGNAIAEGLKYTPREADVMLIEDDCIILRPLMVVRQFQAIESPYCDVVCSPRHSCSNEIIDWASSLGWNFFSPNGEEGVAFWPTFFWAKKEIIESGGPNYGAKTWHAGEISLALAHTFQDAAVMDTFGEASLKIKAMNPGLHFICQNQGHLNQIDDGFYAMHRLGSNQHCGIWSWESPWWAHIGSLSMCLQTMLLDKEGYSLDGSGSKRSLDDLNPASEDIYKQAAFWCWKFLTNFLYEKFDDSLQTFCEEYRQALERLLRKFNVTSDWLQQRYDMYKEIGL